MGIKLAVLKKKPNYFDGSRGYYDFFIIDCYQWDFN